MRHGQSTLAAIGLVAALAMVSCTSQSGDDAAQPSSPVDGKAEAEKTVTFAVSGMV